MTQDRRSLTMSEIMTPNMINFNGNIHGGYVLQLLDRVAYACASRYASQIIVTLSVDEVVFKEPIYVGELLSFYANVNYVGNTSLEVGIRVDAENLLTSQLRHTNTCFFTMVAIDNHGKPTKIPPLTIYDDIQQAWYEKALARRQARLAIREK
jgi:acyl-CoA hydrolase